MSNQYLFISPVRPKVLWALSIGPNVGLFEEKLKEMSEEARKKQLQDLCCLAFGYYDKMSLAYRKFVYKYLKHNRQCYVEFLLEHTPLGMLRYELHFPGLFLKMIHFLETTEQKKRVSFQQLAGCLMLVFIIPDKLSRLPKLAVYLAKVSLLTDDILHLSGKIKIGGEDYL